MERVYIKCNPKNNLPNQEVILPDQRDKEVKELGAIDIFVTNKDNHNLTVSQNKILQ